MRYLGIDYGTKRVGIAISDDNGTLAFPKTILQNNTNLIKVVVDFCEQESIDHIVIGESVHLDGSHNMLMKDIQGFMANLEKLIDVPISLEKEWMSSIAAGSHLYGKGNIANEKWTGKANAKKREYNDAQAAAVILQRYLDRKGV